MLRTQLAAQAVLTAFSDDERVKMRERELENVGEGGC